MKQDWDLLRVLLAAIESETLAAFLKDAEKVEAWKEGQLLSERNKAKQNAGLRIVLLHLKMLIDDGMVTVSGFDTSLSAPGTATTSTGNRCSPAGDTNF